MIPVSGFIDFPMPVQEMQQIPSIDFMSHYWLWDIAVAPRKSEYPLMGPRPAQTYDLLTNNKKLNIDEKYLDKKVSQWSNCYMCSNQ